MNNFEIRTYAPADKDQIINLILSIQKEEFEIPISINDQPDLLEIKSFYQKGNGNFWVAVYNGNVIGTIALIDIGDNKLALRKMFVAKDMRGKELGVAHSLLNAAFAWGRKNKVNAIYLGTIVTFHAAQRFYQKHGFIEIAKNQLPASFPIMQLDTKFYMYQFDKT